MRKECNEYYGMLTRIEAGIPVSVMPEKPQILVYLEQMRAMGLPLYQGGVMDQPYIFMQQLSECLQEEALYNALRSQNDTES